MRLLSGAPFAVFEGMGLAAGSARAAALRKFAEGFSGGGNLQVLPDGFAYEPIQLRASLVLPAATACQLYASDHGTMIALSQQSVRV